MEKGIIEIYEAGSTLAINGGGTGVVEKAIIGANSAVSYQMICYQPERHQIVVSDFEITPVEGKVTKRPIGFATVVEPQPKGVSILVDSEGRIVHIDAPNEVLVEVGALTDEQVEEYNAMQEEINGETKETQEEGEKEAE